MTKIIVSFIKVIKSMVGFLVPDALFQFDFITNLPDYIVYLADVLNKTNFLIPLATIMECIGVMITIKFIKFAIFIYNWIIRSVLDVIP